MKKLLSVLDRQRDDDVGIFFRLFQKRFVFQSAVCLEFKADVGGNTAFGGYDLDLGSIGLDLVIESLDGTDVHALYITQVRIFSFDTFFQKDQNGDGEEDCQKGHQCRKVKANANGKTDACRGPKSGGGGQSRDTAAVAHHDGADAQKADARDDLRTDTERIAVEIQCINAVDADKRGNG